MIHTLGVEPALTPVALTLPMPAGKLPEVHVTPGPHCPALTVTVVTPEIVEVVTAPIHRTLVNSFSVAKFLFPSFCRLQA